MFTSLLTHFAANCKSGFFGFPHWYEYLDVRDIQNGKQTIHCQVATFNVPGDLVLVALAIIDILIHIAGLVAVVYVVIGGVQYVTSQGSPDATAKAQSTVVNALIGLALAITAIAFIAFIGNKVGG
jgi:hypothetical protein